MKNARNINPERMAHHLRNLKQRQEENILMKIEELMKVITPIHEETDC